MAIRWAIERHSSPAFQVRIFEVSEKLAIEIKHAVGDPANAENHRSQYDEVLGLVESRMARIVALAGIQMQSGASGKAEHYSDRTLVTSYPKSPGQNKGKPDRFRPKIEQVKVGTRFEASAVIGPDYKEIEIAYTLEHDTAPPTKLAKSLRPNDSRDPIEVPLPEYHREGAEGNRNRSPPELSK